ncbi:hypothetical protein CFC21_088495 [Triticum aestivum]|uniref:F-box domain-containing protein n=2 Tax=Triticum aestivum TaxID=4565 RepID=A0A9R1IJP8_WHEAT|nr:MEIOTIC F-BOX protein MOF-like [Triticum aestivum]KAF7084996.1 hypothetical protein CFC21_088495 [Triticum aestivum]
MAPDRLSKLPDCLLQAILSSLGARQVLQTTALSRRWRHVWRGALCLSLDIDQREFEAASTDRDGRSSRSVELEEWARFDDFADSLLLLELDRRDGGDGLPLDLDSLRLHVVDHLQASRRRLPLHIKWLDWVHGCLDRYRPAALEIQSDYDIPVDLRLMGLRSDLSRLKTVRLTGVLHSGGLGDSVCPQLENVEFTSCAIGFGEVVTSHTLKKLVMDRCWRRADMKQRAPPLVDAPALTSLRLVLEFQGIWVFRTPSLVEASVRSTRRWVGRADEYQLLCNLYNVTRLELSGFLALEKIRMKRGHQDLPTFHNLTTLLLDECDLTGEVYNMLEFFLNNAPKLEELTLQNCKLPQDWTESKKMCLNLKFREINSHKEGDFQQVDH